jgi:hypothetical protein
VPSSVGRSIRSTWVVFRRAAWTSVRHWPLPSPLAEVELPPGTLRFIKDNWTKRRADSLDRRLLDLIEQLPKPVRALLLEPPGGDILAAMSTDGPQPIEALLRILRNDLSHGNRNYDDRDLGP